MAERRQPRPAAPATPAAPPSLDALEAKAVAVRGVPEGVEAVPGGAADAEQKRWDCPFCGHELHGGVERCAVCGARAVPPDAVAIEALRGAARTIYLLQALTPLCGVSGIPALLLAYGNRGEARDTWLDSHYEWQIESFWGLFWFSLAAAGAGGAMRLVLPGASTGVTVAGLMLASAWFIHRVVKGWTRLADDEPVTEW